MNKSVVFNYELVCIRHTFVKRELLKNDYGVELS